VTHAATIGSIRRSRHELHHAGGFEGFLIIESTHSLDVVAVYTAGTKEGVTSMDVERVFERYLT